MITTALFFTSLAGMIIMIMLKARRLRLEVRSQFSFVSAKVDSKLRHTFASIRRFFSYFNRKSGVALFSWITYHVFAVIRKISFWVYTKAHSHPSSKKVINMVQGRGDTKNSGGASFYLKRITPEENPEGGR